MNPTGRKVLAALVATASITALTTYRSNGPAAAQPAVQTQVWAARASTHLFPDSLPSDSGATAGVSLDTARNEYEAGQVAVRRSKAFTIKRVTFGPLRAGLREIPAPNLTYNFVKFTALNHNSVFGGNQYVYAPSRPAPDSFPDGLSNSPSTTVAANTTQPIWVRVYVPKSAAGGVYRGSVRVETDQGTMVVPLSVNVRPVTIPDAKDSGFTDVEWTLFFGTVSYQEPPVETMLANYGYSPFTPKWWQLMEDYAKVRKEYRNNDLTLPMATLLLQGGTTVDADGKVHFNWSAIDQVVKFFRDRGTVSRLEGFWVNGGPNSGTHWDMETLAAGPDGKAVKKLVPWDSPEGTSWVNQYVAALRDHVKAMGWEKLWWMHIGDEPQGDAGRNGWNGIFDEVKAIWPDVKIGDATFSDPVASEVSQREDITIPNLLNYEWNPGPFDQARAQGKDLWLYNCNIPTLGYLNRFIDQPEYYQRLIGWLAAARNANGHLQWAFNNWNISMDDQDVKGDFWVVNPDREHNLLERTLRLESLRDGIEDWEVVTILKKTHPELATDLALALASKPGTFTGDVTFLDRIRSLVLDAAAGKPLAARDLAATIKTGAAADLGSQHQVDGVYLRWGATHPTAYTIQTSYDGVSWVDAARRTATDGGEDFVGIDGKARYVRLKEAAPELVSFKVAGFALPRPNLVGGKTYTKSWTPPDRFPDSTGLESTDGVISDNWGDGRPYVIQGGPGETKAFDVSFDLGASKVVREADMQGYVEYSGYRPDTVRVLTSEDGQTWTDRGGVSRPNDASGNRFEVRFAPVQARYVKLAFTRTFTASADGVFLDDIEVY
ncbi:glycoside hydrolase domain-containing protein [Kribbella monticola]|uniref:glycoside hydrolase domain-containing protein n=1 Tax=Kribbella monticola TaxID=2185285 RepID=UPI000DD4E347|nr:glycoside hydrolase domain-containing protein [Kribbella monticola]